MSNSSEYYSAAEATARTGMKPSELKRRVTDGLLHESRDPDVLRSVRRAGPGRPGHVAYPVHEIEELRTSVLTSLGVKAEVDALRSELVEVRTAWESEVAATRNRNHVLEEASAQVLTAIDQRLEAWSLQIAADRALLGALRTALNNGDASGS
jgi:hypothetical protein